MEKVSYLITSDTRSGRERYVAHTLTLYYVR